MKRLVLILVALSFGAIAQAQLREGFEDPELNARYRDFIYTIRCMKCQNQSIAESPIDQAADIRALIRERMQDGQSDREIRAYLVSRYGDFISYSPPFKPSTWLLWAAPPLMLVGGIVVFARILGGRIRQPLDEEIE